MQTKTKMVAKIRCWCGKPISKGYVCDEHTTIDIEQFGDYRHGLTGDEIKEYLRRRTNSKAVAQTYQKFCRIAGCNTMAIGPQGQSLMYRHDVERFADKLLLGKPTYFD